MYYLNHYAEKYLNLKKSSRANFWVCIGQFGVGELESTVIFLIACLQSAIGRFFRIESQKNLPIDFGDFEKYSDKKKENWISCWMALTELFYHAQNSRNRPGWKYSPFDSYELYTHRDSWELSQ